MATGAGVPGIDDPHEPAEPGPAGVGGGAAQLRHNFGQQFPPVFSRGFSAM